MPLLVILLISRHRIEKTHKVFFKAAGVSLRRCGLCFFLLECGESLSEALR